MNDIFEQPERVLDLMQDVAEEEILPRFQTLKDHEINEKKPGDLVTVADEQAEEAFRQRLPALLNNSIVVGEEGFESDPRCLEAIAGPAPVWIVDPVDGTHNFAHGKAVFTVIVALQINGATVGGWIIDPMAHEAIWALKGKGTWHRSGNTNARVLLAEELNIRNPKMTAGDKLRRRLIRAAADLDIDMPEIVDRYRCVGREYMDIALGTLDLARYGGLLKPWDHAAGCLIVRESGGKADNILSENPYQASTELTSQSIGVARHKSLWPDFHKLVKRADELI